MNFMIAILYQNERHINKDSLNYLNYNLNKTQKNEKCTVT
jgi:hypothetical protein